MEAGTDCSGLASPRRVLAGCDARVPRAGAAAERAVDELERLIREGLGIGAGWRRCWSGCGARGAAGV